MDKSDALYFSHPECARHWMGTDHPERPDRVRAVDRGLEAAGLLARMTPVEPRRATRTELERVHPASYLDWFDGIAPPAEGLAFIDADTYVNAHTREAALRAAGAGADAVDRILRGEARVAFANVRPPGHHAESDRAMGFCFYSNVAVAAAHALAAHGLERVAVIDFDVHYGNGTDAIFRDEPGVLICSTFQEHIYPPGAKESRSDTRADVSLPAAADGPALRAAVEDVWLPALDRFRAELVFFSAGFDAHARDPIGGLQFTGPDYEWVTRRVLEATRDATGGRAISLLEGGYDLQGLAEGAVAHVGALLEPGT